MESERGRSKGRVRDEGEGKRWKGAEGRTKGWGEGGGGKGELESELARKGISRRGWMLISIFQLRRRRRQDLAGR